jgi:acetamidase/formamidase
VHLLPATLETTQWGWFDNAQAPVLRVNSGDTVVLETMMHSHNQVVPGTTIEQIKKTAHRFPRPRTAHADRTDLYRGGAAGRRAEGDAEQDRAARLRDELQRAGHVRPIPDRLSGRPGQISLSRPRQDADRVPARRRDAAQAVPGHARGRAQGARPLLSSVPPGEFAGNMDIRDFVAGTSLYVPVHVPGALLWTGDSHAGQGNGEVNLTAIETAYKELNITVEVIKGKPLDFPRIETPKSWITMGFDQDLNKAWAQAKAQTVKFLSEQRKRLGRAGGEADGDVSDCRVSQVVNVKKGIHCLNPKNARDKEDMERPTKETSKYYVSHVKDADLNKAMNDASMGMIKCWRPRRRSRGSTPTGWPAWRWIAASARSPTPRRMSIA